MSSMLTDKEKLQVFNQDRSIGTTYADHTAIANPSPGGRFASHSSPPTIVKGGPDYPRISGPWSEPDPTGIEPPTNYRIDEMEPIGGPPEVSQSTPVDCTMDALAREVEPSSAAPSRAYATQVEPTFRRRV
jgi:hypothetical protein